MRARRFGGWGTVVLVLTMTLASCGIFPTPNRPPTCLPTSDPINCVPPQRDSAN